MSLRHEVARSDHVLGPADAVVTLVEYGDFECPFCGEAYWELKRLRGALGDRLRFVYRHFPLTQIHRHARQAAEAAEAAGAQGKFWEMHDLLFENQQDLSGPALLSYAKRLGLDLDRFEDDLEQERFLELIRRQFLEGARSGVYGTPTLFINGVRYEGQVEAEALLQLIEGGLGAYA